MTPQRFLVLVSADGAPLPMQLREMVATRLSDWPSSPAFDNETLVVRAGQGTRVDRSPDGCRLGPTFVRARAVSGGLPADPQARTLYGCWGAYVDIVRGKDGILSILRDPSGALPCYWLQTGEVLALASDIPLLEAAGLLKPIISWRGVTRLLLAIQYRDRDTALTGVQEILPGERLSIAPGLQRIETLWSPWYYTETRWQIDNPRQAIARLEATVLEVVAAWASLFERPLLSLSGGLDSSVVAAALAANGRHFDAFTLATETLAGDERDFARQVADHVGAPLTEHVFEVERIDPFASAGAHLPRPGARAFLQETDRVSLALAAQHGSDGWFHGGGGDNVFSSIQSVAPILDRLTTLGPSRAAWRTTCDVAALTGADFGTIGAFLWERLRSKRRSYRWTLDPSLLARDAIADAGLAFDHPWLCPPAGALAGKATHIAGLLAIQNYLEGSQRERSLFAVAPLLSQPLVELCLRIPSWLWIAGGLDRAVARAAFADRLPASIIARRTKGTADAVRAELFERHRTALRPMLLEGLLARHRIIDRDAVERVLADVVPAEGGLYERIMSLCDAEAWARSVESRRH